MSKAIHPRIKKETGGIGILEYWIAGVMVLNARTQA
jgi:hypothetical protein